MLVGDMRVSSVTSVRHLISRPTRCWPLARALPAMPPPRPGTRSWRQDRRAGSPTRPRLRRRSGGCRAASRGCGHRGSAPHATGPARTGARSAQGKAGHRSRTVTCALSRGGSAQGRFSTRLVSWLPRISHLMPLRPAKISAQRARLAPAAKSPRYQTSSSGPMVSFQRVIRAPSCSAAKANRPRRRRMRTSPKWVSAVKNVAMQGVASHLAVRAGALFSHLLKGLPHKVLLHLTSK